MDIQLKKRPWYRKHPFLMIVGTIGLCLMLFAFVYALGPRRIDADKVEIATVEEGRFREYVDVEGIVHPIMTMKINALESGFVDRVVACEGEMLTAGDTIVVLKNADLLRTIYDEQAEWEHQRRLYREQEIEMAQKTLTLRRQALDAQFEMKNLETQLALAREEFGMGMKSKAELDAAEEKYEYQKQKINLQILSLQHDSLATVLRQELLQGDIARANVRRDRTLERTANLVVRAPADGQLSFLNVTPGQQVAAGSGIGEIKILSDYKVRVALNEYYIDRVTSGLPASIVIGNERYPLCISRVMPEVKDRTFAVDLIFTGERPSSLRVGKSFRVQIELGQPAPAVVIPSGDFYGETGGSWIYKIDGGKAHKTPIVIGRKNPLQYEIISGLKSGDKVIIGGYNSIGNAENLIISGM